MIVALHGFTATPAMWTPMGLTGPSLLGHGSESLASGSETFADEVKRLCSLLPSVPVHLVGYSLGARLALAIAIQQPERLRALTLIGCNPGIDDADERAERIASDESWCHLLETEGIVAFTNAWEALPLWESQVSLPASTRAVLREQRLAHDPGQLALALRALGTGVMPPMWKHLPNVSLAVQIVVGELDDKYQAIGRTMCQKLPSATFHSVSYAGHNPVLENPHGVQTVIHQIS